MVRRRRSLTWRHELKLRPVEFAVVAGVDEVGRGCWAGPVYAGAAILPPGFRHKHLHDSKLLLPGHREELGDFLCSHADVVWAVGVATLEEIELHNILQASLLAMRRAVAALRLQPQFCLVDGNQRAGLGCAELAVIDGDAKCPSIAAAAVIAKVHRDRAMVEMAALYPQYGLENHKGYGTPEHQRALALHGPSAIHRRAFKPVRAHAGAEPELDLGDRDAW